jgi:hypothetical protein
MLESTPHVLLFLDCLFECAGFDHLSESLDWVRLLIEGSRVTAQSKLGIGTLSGLESNLEISYFSFFSH